MKVRIETYESLTGLTFKIPHVEERENRRIEEIEYKIETLKIHDRYLRLSWNTRNPDPLWIRVFFDFVLSPCVTYLDSKNKLHLYIWLNLPHNLYLPLSQALNHLASVYAIVASLPLWAYTGVICIYRASEWTYRELFLIYLMAFYLAC